MQINITLSQADWLKYQTYIQKKLSKENARQRSWWINLIVWFFIGLLSMIFYRQFDSFHYPSAAFVTTAFALLAGYYFYGMIKLRNAFMPSTDGTFVGEHTFIFDETGIQSNGKGHNSFHSWSVVKSIVHDAGMVMIFIDTAHAFLFPDNQLPDAASFVSKLNELHSGTSSSTTARD